VAETCRQESYTPPPATALCPRCGHAEAAVDPGPTLRYAALFYDCGACGGKWNECRDHGQAPLRIWMPNAAPTPA
jgi:hypothetical protein